MTIGDKIKYYREQKGMSQDDLAKAVGYKGRSAVCRIESGERELRQKGIMLFAKALDIDPVMLLDDRKQAEEPVNMNSIVMIPEIATVAAGFDTLPITEFEHELFPIPLAYITTARHKINDLFIVSVRGDSMWPLYQNGDRILSVRTSVIRSGAVAIVQYGDCATIKQVEILSNGIKLIPINPMFQPEIITDNATVRVIGIPLLLLREIHTE